MSSNKVSTFRTKPITVTAYQTPTAMNLLSPGGVVVASPGDWIVTNPEGEMFPISPLEFARKYELV